MEPRGFDESSSATEFHTRPCPQEKTSSHPRRNQHHLRLVTSLQLTRQVKWSVGLSTLLVICFRPRLDAPFGGVVQEAKGVTHVALVEEDVQDSGLLLSPERMSNRLYPLLFLGAASSADLHTSAEPYPSLGMRIVFGARTSEGPTLAAPESASLASLATIVPDLAQASYLCYLVATDLDLTPATQLQPTVP